MVHACPTHPASCRGRFSCLSVPPPDRWPPTHLHVARVRIDLLNRILHPASTLIAYPDQLLLPPSFWLARRSPECVDLLNHILHPDPDMRFDLDDVGAHPWMRT